MNSNKKSANENLNDEIFIDATLKDYPLRDYKNIVSDMNSIIKDYDKLNARNKHAMHLIRLYLMALDILEKEEIITYFVAQIMEVT